jgi:hypothetical protein
MDLRERAREGRRGAAAFCHALSALSFGWAASVSSPLMVERRGDDPPSAAGLHRADRDEAAP